MFFVIAVVEFVPASFDACLFVCLFVCFGKTHRPAVCSQDSYSRVPLGYEDLLHRKQEQWAHHHGNVSRPSQSSPVFAVDFCAEVGVCLCVYTFPFKRPTYFCLCNKGEMALGLWRLPLSPFVLSFFRGIC